MFNSKYATPAVNRWGDVDMAEQEANQVNENPQTSEQAGKATVNGDGAGGQVFSQDEVNRMIKARAERELKAVLQEAGLAEIGRAHV